MLRWTRQLGLLVTSLALLGTACNSNLRQATGPLASSSPATAIGSSAGVLLLRSSDLPPGWSIQSDTLPNGLTLNNGGPVGRQQAPNVVRTGDTTGLATRVSDEYGDGSNLRAWDMVVTGRAAGLSAAYDRVQSNWFGFAGIMETEALQAYPDLSAMPSQLDFGKPTAAPVDLGSYGVRTSSYQVTTIFVYAGQPKPVFLDLVMIELPRYRLLFGFLSALQPPPSVVPHVAIQKVLSRAA